MADSYQPPLGPKDTPPDGDRIDDHVDPRLDEPGTQGQPGSFVDTDQNMPGQQGDPPPPPSSDEDRS